MKAELTTVEVAPAVPAVIEDRVVLELSIHEARVLRALYGKSSEAHGRSKVEFLSVLNEMFPADYTICYDGISSVTIKGDF